jgi:hypothetical protein
LANTLLLLLLLLLRSITLGCGVQTNTCWHDQQTVMQVVLYILSS